MSKSCDRVEIHLVTLGKKVSHVDMALKKYRPHYLVFITNESGDIRENSDEYREELLANKAYRNHLKDIQMIYLDPFQPNFIFQLLTRYIALRDELHKSIIKEHKGRGPPNIEWIANITGGTNSMAAAIALIALIFEMQVYYVLHPSMQRGKTDDELILDQPIFADIIQGVTYCRSHPAQAETLIHLSSKDRPCSAHTLMEELEKKSAGSISKRLKPLVARGYVQKIGERNAEYNATPLGLAIARLIGAKV